MGSMRRRLEQLEEHTSVKEEHNLREFFKRLTREEILWLDEPGRQAERLVACPHVELVGCGCRSVERQRRGFEARPDLHQEYLKRQASMLERVEEIMQRDER